jgi:hypothetical protein
MYTKQILHMYNIIDIMLHTTLKLNSVECLRIQRCLCSTTKIIREICLQLCCSLEYMYRNVSLITITHQLSRATWCMI